MKLSFQVFSARRRTLTVAAIVCAAGGMYVGLIGMGTGTFTIPETAATWRDSDFTSAQFTAATLRAPTGLRCAPKSGTIIQNITFNWVAPSAVAPGVADNGYILSWSGSAGTGQVVVASTATTAVVAASRFNTVGNSTVVVSATRATWSSPVSPAVRVTTTGAATVSAFFTCG